MADEFVESVDELLEEFGQFATFGLVERRHDRTHQVLASLAGLSVTPDAGFGGRDHDHPSVVTIRRSFGEPGSFESLHRTGRGGRVDAQGFGEITHPPSILLDEEIEGVHLPALEGALTRTEDVVDE